jgi:hypothetical protein
MQQNTWALCFLCGVGFGAFLTTRFAILYVQSRSTYPSYMKRDGLGLFNVHNILLLTQLSPKCVAGWIAVVVLPRPV